MKVSDFWKSRLRVLGLCGLAAVFLLPTVLAAEAAGAPTTGSCDSSAWLAALTPLDAPNASPVALPDTAPAPLQLCSGDWCGCYDPPCINGQCAPNDWPCIHACIKEQKNCAIWCCGD